MRLMRKTLTAVGCIMAVNDPHKIYNANSISMYGDTSISATAQVDRIISDPGNNISATVSRSGTSATLTFSSPHLLGGTSDYVQIRGTGVSSLDGIYPVASVTSTTVVTYTSPVSGTVSATNCVATPLKFYANAIASGSVSATTPVVLSDVKPTYAFILNCTIYSAGTVIMDVLSTGIK